MAFRLILHKGTRTWCGSLSPKGRELYADIQDWIHVNACVLDHGGSEIVLQFPECWTPPRMNIISVFTEETGDVSREFEVTLTATTTVERLRLTSKGMTMGEVFESKNN